MGGVRLIPRILLLQASATVLYIFLNPEFPLQDIGGLGFRTWDVLGL